MSDFGLALVYAECCRKLRIALRRVGMYGVKQNKIDAVLKETDMNIPMSKYGPDFE